MFPCPACGKPTKVTQNPNLRICSLCRKVSPADRCTDANAPKLRGRQGLSDSVGTRDTVVCQIETRVVPPFAPCCRCGKETKAHHDGARICRPCNLVQ